MRGLAPLVRSLQEGQPTKNYITNILETIGGVLYSLGYDIENGKDNLVEGEFFS